MKWTIVFLMLLGVGAAAAATVLIASLRTTPQQPAGVAADARVADVEILVAAKALAVMTVVDRDAVTTQSVPIDEVPPGSLRSPVKAIGKLLAVPLVKGQLFTEACFATDASGAHLASTLADGLRAMSLSLPNDKAGLLYPGSLVDVLVSLTIPSDDGEQRGEAIVMTLLQSISVLAIDNRTVLTGSEGASEKDFIGRRGNRMVTLKVDPNQAKALQLATRFGTVSLALRNPMDSGAIRPEATLLSELKNEYSGLLARLSGREFPPADAAARDRRRPPPTAQRTESMGEPSGKCELCGQSTWSTLGVCTREGECRDELRKRLKRIPSTWDVAVWHGMSKEIVTVDIPEPPEEEPSTLSVTAAGSSGPVADERAGPRGVSDRSKEALHPTP